MNKDDCKVDTVVAPEKRNIYRKVTTSRVCLGHSISYRTGIFETSWVL